MQLDPNSFCILVGFVILYHFHCIYPRLSLFRIFFKLNKLHGSKGWYFLDPRKGRKLINLLNSIYHWKAWFFFVSSNQCWGSEQPKESWISLPIKLIEWSILTRKISNYFLTWKSLHWRSSWLSKIYMTPSWVWSTLLIRFLYFWFDSYLNRVLTFVHCSYEVGVNDVIQVVALKKCAPEDGKKKAISKRLKTSGPLHGDKVGRPSSHDHFLEGCRS